MRSQNLYRHFDKDGLLLYVGVSLSAVHRLSQHRCASHWFDDIAKVTIEKFDSRQEALTAERLAVANEKPRHNLLGRPPKYTAADESSDEIVRSVVFDPLYTFYDAAQALCVKESFVRELVETGKLGFVCLGVRKRWGNKILRITGWQLIDYIENLENT